jgi:CRP-like cAMP-binding protein
MATPRPTEQANRLLALSKASDLEHLLPHLTAVDLPLHQRLEVPGRPIEHVYFIEQGIASVVVNGRKEGAIEAGVIGREGMTGLATVLETDRSPHEIFMQVAGSGQRITVDKFRQALGRCPDLDRNARRFVHVFMVQVSYTALANGRGRLEERLARWLVMASDRVDGDLPLTHEFLATMLGVRRPGVTLALSLLEKRGLIGRRRGLIVVVDRAGLIALCRGSYGQAEAEWERLFPSG